MIDESTYGFNKSDAAELVQLIGGGDVEFEEMKPPTRSGFDIDFQVDGCDTIQYRINNGSWITIAKLRLRLSGTNLQLSLDPSTNPTYCTWETTTECPE